MKLSVELTEPQHSQVGALVARLHVSAEALAAAVLRDLLSGREDDLEAVARVVAESTDLHRPRT